MFMFMDGKEQPQRPRKQRELLASVLSFHPAIKEAELLSKAPWGESLLQKPASSLGQGVNCLPLVGIRRKGSKHPKRKKYLE